MSEHESASAVHFAELGLKHARGGYLFKAVSHLGTAWRLEQTHEVAANLAACLQRLGRVREAVRVLDEALVRWMDSSELHRLLGEAWLTLSAPAKAAEAFSLAIVLAGAEPSRDGDEGTFRAWHGLGLAELRLHHWAEAAAAQTQALLLRPRSLPALTALVQAQVALMGRHAALEAAVAKVRLDFTDAGLLARAFAIHELWPETLALLREAPSLPDNMLLAAEAHLRSGDLPVTLGALDLVELQLPELSGSARRRIRQQVITLRLMVAWLTGDQAAAARLRTAYRLPTYLQVFQCTLHDRGFRPRLSRREREGLCNLLEKLLSLQRPDLAVRVLDLLEAAFGNDPVGGLPLPAAQRRRLATKLCRSLQRHKRVELAGTWLLAELKGETGEGLLIPAGVAQPRKAPWGEAAIDRLMALGDLQFALSEPGEAANTYRNVLAQAPDHLSGTLGLVAATLAQAGRLHPTRGDMLQAIGEEVQGERQMAESRPDLTDRRSP